MFKISERETVKRTVSFKRPGKGNSFINEKFTAEFLIVDIDRAAEIWTDTDDASGAVFLKEVFVGVEGIGDEEGNPLVFNDELRDQLIKIPYLTLPLLEAYRLAVTGGNPRSKN